MSNRDLAIAVIESLISKGVQEFVLCPGGRNAPLVNLISTSSLTYSCWPEERSAAFFALGRARKLGQPVAVIVTSGTAAGELLPAMMEAYYLGVPLVAVTADRPGRYRGTGAPQTAEQEKIFGVYATCNIDDWDFLTPLHLNVAFEEPTKDEVPYAFSTPTRVSVKRPVGKEADLHLFLESVERPLVIVGELAENDREEVVKFLEKLHAPVYVESPSGLKGISELEKFRVYLPQIDQYDAFLRIGGVPTHRIWRDLETKNALSISSNPFSGLPDGKLIYTDLKKFFRTIDQVKTFTFNKKAFQENYRKLLIELYLEEPTSEQSLVYQLSQSIDVSSKVYLGNSLPIREWDLASETRHEVCVSRGLNGIDGQLSTFFGLSDPKDHHVAIVGDLTTLYDLVAPWCLQERPLSFALVIINNGGGKIFSSRFTNPLIQNCHDICFEHFAHLWKLPYQLWEEFPENPHLQGVIEMIPDEAATLRFSEKHAKIRERVLCLS